MEVLNHNVVCVLPIDLTILVMSYLNVFTFKWFVSKALTSCPDPFNMWKLYKYMK